MKGGNGISFSYHHYIVMGERKGRKAGGSA